MKLAPYLYFEGTCEDAIDFYQSIFDGTIPSKNYYRVAPMDVPESHKDKILHCQLDFGNNTIMACDAFPGQKISDDSGIVLSIRFNNEAQAGEIFDQLGEDGTINMPFEKQFWGAWLGQVRDKFGKSWIISTSESD